MAKRTFKILRCHRKILKVCLAILQHARKGKKLDFLDRIHVFYLNIGYLGK